MQRKNIQVLCYIEPKLCKIDAKLNAKYARLAMIALNLCKIYAKLNAKYVRSKLKSTQIK